MPYFERALYIGSFFRQKFSTGDNPFGLAADVNQDFIIPDLNNGTNNTGAAADILNISAENYRQRLSRSRKKVGDFLKQYCGLVNKDSCSCQKRLGVAIKTHRLNPQHLEYSDHVKIENFIQNMEDLDEISDVYREEVRFCSHLEIKEFLKKLLQSRQLNEVMNEGRETA